MFEVRIMVEDSKLHKVLWALDGMIVGQPQLLPVRNAVPSKDKKQVKEKLPGGASITMRLWDRLGTPGTTFDWEAAADIVKSFGANRSGTSAYLSRLLKEKKIIREGKGLYKVVVE